MRIWFKVYFIGVMVFCSRIDSSADICGSNPCQNSGTCDDNSEGYTCNCKQGYTGNNCQTAIDYCQPNDICGPLGECLSQRDTYYCRCKHNEIETYCYCEEKYRIGKTCHMFGESCPPNPCGMNGTCRNAGNDKFKCKCDVGFNGTRCEQKDHCLTQSCLNNGTCINQPSGYECKCTEGFTGENCETDIDECLSNPCSSHGNCTNGHNTYYCSCEPGFTGSRCEDNIDECVSNPCATSRLCVDGINSNSCICFPGYTGEACETEIDECLSQPCLNNGTCEDMLDGYSCVCGQAYTGGQCENERSAVVIFIASQEFIFGMAGGLIFICVVTVFICLVRYKRRQMSNSSCNSTTNNEGSDQTATPMIKKDLEGNSHSQQSCEYSMVDMGKKKRNNNNTNIERTDKNSQPCVNTDKEESEQPMVADMTEKLYYEGTDVAGSGNSPINGEMTENTYYETEGVTNQIQDNKLTGNGKCGISKQPIPNDLTENTYYDSSTAPNQVESGIPPEEETYTTTYAHFQLERRKRDPNTKK